jgi:hypothetical protein
MNGCQVKITAQHSRPVLRPALACGTGVRFCCSSRKTIRSRSAITSIDIIVSAVLLGAVLSTATALCFRINQIWKGISHQRVATQELSNQLDDLTRLNAEELDSAIQKLQASSLCLRSLQDPKLIAEVTKDELGVRVDLRIRWTAHSQPMQAELAGWLIDPKASGVPGPAESPLNPEPKSPPQTDRPQSSSMMDFSPATEGS